MASLETTVTGRVFLISTPRVRSSLARTTSPRRTPTTLLLVLQDGPRLRVAHFPIGQQIAFPLRLCRTPLCVIRPIRLGYPSPFNRVEVRGEHPGDDPTTSLLRNQRVCALDEVTRQGHAHDLVSSRLGRHGASICYYCY